jgi:hypothetical protein
MARVTGLSDDGPRLSVWACRYFPVLADASLCSEDRLVWGVDFHGVGATTLAVERVAKVLRAGS